MTRKAIVIARFEFFKTVKRKGFILGTLGLPLLLLLIAGLTVYSGTGFGTTPDSRITGYVDTAGFTREEPGFIAYQNIDEGKAALLKGDITRLLLIPGDFLATGNLTVYTTDTSMIGSTGNVQVTRDFLARNLLRDANVSDTITRTILEPKSPDTIILDPSGKVKDNQDLVAFLLPFVVTIILALSILTSSGYLMLGIGEEKESRRGEFLLSHCSAEQLLTGKILGYAAVGLVEMAAWILIGILVIMATPAAALFSGMHLSGTLAIAVIYFILGFFLFSVSIACTASLAPSVREAQQVSAIFTMFAVFPLVFLQFLISDPDSLLMQVLTYFPYTAPFVAMVRLTVADLQTFEILASLAVMVITIAVLTKVSARIFRMGMLLYGKRATLKDVIGYIRQG